MTFGTMELLICGDSFTLDNHPALPHPALPWSVPNVDGQTTQAARRHYAFTLAFPSATIEVLHEFSDDPGKQVDTMSTPLTDSDRHPDVVVIGGGPAGSAVSTLIAQQGYRVTLFERERFPRFHIGESLIPETYWVLKRLGMLDKMKQSHFVKKYSVQFVNASGKLSAPFYFWDNKPHECSQTWQVVRSEFDLMMLNNAREHGVEAHEGMRVLDVLLEDDRAVGVRVQGEDRSSWEVRAHVVVDATGQSTLLQNRFKLRLWDPVLNKGALWTYWQGAVRDTGRDEGATIVIQTPNREGWFWYIPLHNDIVSVGVVAPFAYLFKGRGGHEATYKEEVERCPAVKARVSSARRVTGIFATKDYSYRAKQIAGTGWVLVGDALGFLDPLYSSGVLLALRSGELAADAIVEGLRRNNLSAQQLGNWSESFNQGIDRMRRLVCEYYDGFSFGGFIRAYPHLKGTVTDLLIGDLFTDRVDAVWGPMESMYPPGKQPPVPWFAQAPPDIAENKVNELFLPTGPRP
jgi:flavin-dependent dehydrogenase